MTMAGIRSAPKTSGRARGRRARPVVVDYRMRKTYSRAKKPTETDAQDKPRWRFEWSNIRDGAGVFVR